MALEVALIAGLAVVLAYLMLLGAPEFAHGIVVGREVLSGTIAIVGGLILISTDMIDAMVVGFLLVFIIALTIFDQDKHKEVW